jgi:hypothetical protein
MSRLLSDAAIWVAILTAILGLGSYFVHKAAEARSTNRAILAEVNRLLAVVKEHRAFWEREVDAGTTDHHPLIPFSHVVFNGQVANVGVIRRKLVAEVVEFYGYVDYLNSFQALRKDYIAAGHTGEFNKMYLRSMKRLLDDFEKVFASAVKQERILSAG